MQLNDHGAGPINGGAPPPQNLTRATLSHDLQNHLQVVASALHIVEQRALSGDASVRAAISGATGSLVRIATLARHLSEEPKAAPPARTISIAMSLSAIADQIALAVGPSVRVDIVGDDLCADVRCNALELENVILNLAVNARDAMPRGGRLTIETYRELQCASGSNALPRTWAALRVSDTGGGMSPEIASRVFTPYFTTKSRRGAGLGLPSVRDFALRAGGSIDLQSEVGVGTTILLRLPVAERI